MKPYSGWKTKYKHTGYHSNVNKKMLPINTLHLDDGGVEEFNRILDYCKHNYAEAPATRSRGMSNGVKWRFLHRYTVFPSNQSWELVIVCYEGCYRFVLKNRVSANNTVKGTKACREIYEQADKYGIDFSKYAQGTKATKDEIVSPHINVMLPGIEGRVIEHCHHLDLNSAYASMIVKAYPELKEMYDDLYEHRKDNDGYYKHVLTNSIGAWQSEFCVDYETRRKSKPYAFANLSKIAINETRAYIERLMPKMLKQGCIPLLTNTDGIWYTGPLYHDEDEGEGLGQWKNEHINSKLLIKSKGAYQYLENGVCHSVVRGLTNLDLLEEREDWGFGDIMKPDVSVQKYRLTDKGVEKVWVNV